MILTKHQQTEPTKKEWLKRVPHRKKRNNQRPAGGAAGWPPRSWRINGASGPRARKIPSPSTRRQEPTAGEARGEERTHWWRILEAGRHQTFLALVSIPGRHGPQCCCATTVGVGVAAVVSGIGGGRGRLLNKVSPHTFGFGGLRSSPLCPWFFFSREGIFVSLWRLLYLFILEKIWFYSRLDDQKRNFDLFFLQICIFSLLCECKSYCLFNFLRDYLCLFFATQVMV